MKYQKTKSIIVLFFIITSKSMFAQIEQDSTSVPLSSESYYYDYQDSWAVIIGINNYRYLPELDFAITDAEAIKDVLIHEFDYKDDHIILLTEEQATLQRIREVLGDELPKKVRENDRVLVYWAGHGHVIDLPNGGEIGYLIPADGSLTNLYSTCLSMSEINSFAKLIPAKQLLLLIDAPFSGLATERTRDLGDIDREYFERIIRAKAVQIITAGRPAEAVIESSRWGHSVFAYELIKGLKEKLADYNNDGIITATELATYLKPNVTKRSNYRQTPQYHILDGKGEFVFVSVKTETGRSLNDMIPIFKLPPPKASTFTVIPSYLIRQPNDTLLTFGDVDQSFQRVFDSCGYFEKSYYAIKDGFVIVTRIEKINFDGTAKEPPERWELEIKPLRKFSLKEYLKALFFARVGFYRFIVFVFTQYPFSQTEQELSLQETQAWLSGGGKFLPSLIGQKIYSDDYKCIALVYEFEKNGPEEDPKVKYPGRLTAKIHLEKANLWQMLEK